MIKRFPREPLFPRYSIRRSGSMMAVWNIIDRIAAGEIVSVPDQTHVNGWFGTVISKSFARLIVTQTTNREKWDKHWRFPRLEKKIKHKQLKLFGG